jgi:hypothetical protein
MFRQFFVGNARAAGTWLGTPVGLVGGWLFIEWLSSTNSGVLVGLIGASLMLVGLIAAVAGLVYIVRD